MCQSHTGHLTGLWFLPKPAFALNTNDDDELHCWLGVTQYVWSLSPLTVWGRFDLNSAFSSCLLFRKHGRPVFRLHERRATSGDLFLYGLKTYQLLKYLEGCWCCMGTVLCRNGMSANGLRGSKMATQTLSWRKELDQQLHAWLASQSRIF